MATTAEKSKEIVDAFVRKGELTVEQGRIINEELKRDVKKTVSQAEDTVKRHVEIAVDSDAPLVRKSLLEQLEQMSPEELELLRSKLAEMEKRIPRRKPKSMRTGKRPPVSVKEAGGSDNTAMGSRFRELLGILRRHDLVRGLTPEKLRAVLEDMGPTFIKLGQIMSMHPDMLPKEYCQELSKLRADVKPLPFQRSKG